MEEAILYRADGTYNKTITPANGKSFTLQECYNLIGCELIEIINLGERGVLIIDEEGKLKDEPVVNVTATLIFNLTFPHLAGKDYIVGNAIYLSSHSMLA